MEHPAYDAVFFDLDGTLLPMELDEFLSKYFTLLGSYSAACGFDPRRSPMRSAMPCAPCARPIWMTALR